MVAVVSSRLVASGC